MSHEDPSFTGEASPSVILHVHDVRSRFQAAWDSGDSPRIEAYLDDAVETRRVLLFHLLQIELQALSARGEAISLSAYESRFPADLDLVRSIFQAVLEAEGDTVDWPGPDTDRDGSADTSEEVGGELKGKFGGYEVLRLLGGGGFGAVYLARDTKLDRQVALKIPLPDRKDRDDQVNAMLREARLAAQLSHPHIVTVHETGTIDSLSYIATDYVEGETLRRRMAGDSIAPRKAAQLVAKLASALHYAHSKGVIHRDVKPANILIDRDEQPHIADFGLARLDHPDESPDGGRRLGTPAYMSPEQARGDSHQADARSDLWCLGVVLFELLAGRRPFTGSVKELFESICHRPAPSVREFNPQAPRDLAAIVARSLAREPDDRYPSCQHLADDLERWLAGRPVHARPVGPVERLAKWSRRQPLAAAMLLVAIGLAGWSVTATILGLQADLRTAQLEQQQIREERERAERERIHSLYLNARDADLTGQWPTVIDRANAALTAQHPNEVELRLMLVRAYEAEFEPAKYREQVNLLSKLDSVGEHRARVLLLQADTAMIDGDSLPAERLLAQAAEVGLSTAESAYLAGLTTESAPEAVEHYRRAVEADPLAVHAWKLLCGELLLLGELDKAQSACLTASGRFPRSPDFPTVLALIYHLRDDREAALEQVRMVKQLAGEGYVNLLTILMEFLTIGRDNMKLGESPNYLGIAAKATALLKLRGGMFGPQSQVRLPKKLKQQFVDTVQAIPGYVSGVNREPMQEAFDKMTRSRPEATLYLLHAAVLIQSGRQLEAEDALRKAADAPALFPEARPLAMTMLVSLLVAHPIDGEDEEVRHREALVFAKRRLAIDALSKPDLVLVAGAAYSEGEFELAIQVARQGLRQYPDDQFMHRTLMVSYFKLDAFRKSFDHANELLKLDANDEQAARFVGWNEERIAAIEKIEKANPPAESESANE